MKPEKPGGKAGKQNGVLTGRKTTSLIWNTQYTTDENAMKCYHIFLQIADFIFLFITYSFTKENENLGYKTFGALLNFYKEIRKSFLLDIIEFGEINSIKQMRLITPLPSNKSA